jgi:hypothetical protein
MARSEMTASGRRAHGRNAATSDSIFRHATSGLSMQNLHFALRRRLICAYIDPECSAVAIL